jgi:hypothetical protein
VSLLAWEGRTVLEVAAEAGHGVDVRELYYARIFEDYDPARRTSAERAIQLLVDPKDARWTSSGAITTRANEQSRSKCLHMIAKPTGGLEPPTPSLRVMCSTS